MKRTTRRVLLAALVAVFLVSGAMTLRQLGDYQKGEETYGSAESLAGLPDFSAISWPEESGSGSAAAQDPAVPYVDPYADALAAMDFAALREVNPDILGWILIPNTRVSYPFLQGTDNDYYLRRTWRKGSSAVGAIFVEASNSGDLTDFNTVIYGHNMNNGSMFGTLKKYKDLSYFRSIPMSISPPTPGPPGMRSSPPTRWPPTARRTAWALAATAPSGRFWTTAWNSR